MTDLDVRYRRLFASTVGPSRRLVEIAVGLLPLAITAVVLSVSVGTQRRVTIGQYLAAVLFAVGLVWFLRAATNLRGGRLSRFGRLHDELVVVLSEISSASSYMLAASDSPTLLSRDDGADRMAFDCGTDPRPLPLRALFAFPWDLDLANVYRRGFSLGVLWLEVEPLLSDAEEGRIRAVLEVRRRLGYLLGGSLISLVSTCYVVGVQATGGYVADLATLGPLAVAALAAGIAVAIERVALTVSAFELQSATTLRHSQELTGAYGLAGSTPQERASSLTLLSLLLLTGKAGAPSATLATSDEDRHLRGIVDQSIRKAISSKPAVNVSGGIRFRRTLATPTRAQLEVELWTGADALAQAENAPDRYPFRLSGGVDAAAAEARVVVESPGLEVEPRRASAVIRTSGDSHKWYVELTGTNADVANAWVTLYWSDRFVRASRLSGVDNGPTA